MMPLKRKRKGLGYLAASVGSAVVGAAGASSMMSCPATQDQVSRWREIEALAVDFDKGVVNEDEFKAALAAIE